MMTAELGACEWFVWDLRRSNLVERGRLEQIVAEFMMRHPNAEPADLANFLVEQKVLTRFQADQLLNGKSQGLVLGPFIVHDVLGTGTMGTVYQALSKVDNKWYAVKVLPRRSMWNIRLARRKVRDFEQFQHPAVVPFVDVGTSGAMHYLAWPLVEGGESLNKIVERDGKLSAAQTALYAMYCAEGLEACHQRNIIHGLLKPSNLMVTGDDVKILDFGVGSLLRETEGESVVDTMSTANTLASGLDCASPESIMDPTSTSFASDQYSLGCIMYYCLTGQYPFPGNNAVEKMMAHQAKQPTPISELAPETQPELIAIIDRLMQKRPEDRYPSISELIVALRPLAMQRDRSTSSSGSTKLSGLRPIPEELRRLGRTGEKPASGLVKAAAPTDSAVQRGGGLGPMPGKFPAAPPHADPAGQRMPAMNPPVMNTGRPAQPPMGYGHLQGPPQEVRPDMMGGYRQQMFANPDEIRVSNYPPPAGGLTGKQLAILVAAVVFSLLLGMGGMFAFLWFFVINKPQ